MNTRVLPWLVVATFLLAFTACKKEDDDSPSNSFTLNGNQYTLSNGFIQEFGDNGNGSFDWDVILTSSGITFDESNQNIDGKGDVVYLDFNTSSAAGLVSGTYEFSSTREPLTFVDAEVSLNLNVQTFFADEVHRATSGSVDIMVEGEIVTFSFSLTVQRDNIERQVTGGFSGALQPIR